MFFNKIKLFFYKENNKKFSIVKIIIKAVLSVIIIALLPIIFFLIFIYKEPREIKSVNDYINSKLIEFNVIKDLDYKNAKISFDKRFNFVYIVEDLKVNFSNIQTVIPKVIFKISFVDLLMNKISVNSLYIRDLVLHFNYKENDKKENNITYANPKNVLYNLIETFYNKDFIFKNIYIDNSNFYFLNEKSLDKIELLHSSLKLDKKLIDFIVDLDLSIKMNDNEKIDFSSYCKIDIHKKVLCKTILNNMYTSKLFKIINKDMFKYSDNVDGKFNIEFNTLFEDYIKLKDSNFKVSSTKGNFNLKEFFANRVFYKNLVIDGNIINNNNIILKEVNAELSDDNKNYMNFYLDMDFKDKDSIKLNIKLHNANFNKTNTFYPVFFSEFGIREWVIEHFKYGNINTAYVYMDFIYKENDYFLDNLTSEINFSKTFLDYADDFPPIKNLNAIAKFTENDVIIYINSGELEKTKIKNGKIYINFDDEESSVNILAETVGNPIDMLYFIDYNEKDKIYNITKNYINGLAKSKISIDVPLIDDLDFKDVRIKIYSEINNVNSIVFSNDSNIILSLFKNYNSNKLNLNLNLLNSYINYDIIELIKNKNEKLNINTDIIVNKNFVLLDNIISKDEVLSFSGNGLIENGELLMLSLNNIRYLDNDFNLNYKNNKFNIYGNNINLKFDDKNIKNNYINDFYFNIYFNNVKINKKYNFNFVNLLYDIDNYKLFSNDFEIELKNNKIVGHVIDFGNFLNKSNINNKIIGGDLYFDGEKKEDSININARLKNNFSIITSEAKTSSKLFRKLIESEFISNKLKENLKNENSISFKKAISEFSYKNNELDINSFTLESDNFFGIGIGGKGKININSGNIDFNGVVIPVDKLNTLFGLNKIPFIKDVLFGGRNGGLFTVGYEFKKENYNSDFNFKLLPISTSSINSFKNAFLLLLLL